jgi:hypothetical protein
LLLSILSTLVIMIVLTDVSAALMDLLSPVMQTRFGTNRMFHPVRNLGRDSRPKLREEWVE